MALLPAPEVFILNKTRYSVYTYSLQITVYSEYTEQPSLISEAEPLEERKIYSWPANLFCVHG